MALPNLCARPKISFILIFSLCLFQMKSSTSAAVTTPLATANTPMPASEQQTRNQVANEDKTANEPMVPTDIDTETTATGATTDTSSDANWWRNAIFYQIYPRSFMDSDGDGVGDLKGITMKLPYLIETGIHAIWLSPIFKSPMVDFGYDISDFRAIHPEYGTMEDFEALIAEANRLGIKIILDFVPNHTSNESDWFQKSAAREDGYEDFYVWADGKMDANGERMPPNNWQSVFYGSAWTWHDTRQQYYLHQFTAGQPDLNFRNPKVVAAMDEVLHYWLQRGVSGFRVDAINHMFEDAELRDEPLSGTTDDKLSYEYTDHIYTKDLPEVLEMLQHWRRLLDDFTATHGGPARILMTEAYSDVKRLMDYYETADGRLGAHFPFNFNLMTDLNKQSDARDYVFNVHKWLTYMPRGHAANWVMGNHDNPRMASRHGAERVDAMNMLLMTLPGVAVTYNGEEIGMQDYRDMSWEDTVDPPARNVGPQKYKMVSRDPERTPFQWNANKNAGFSTADKTWLPVHPNFKQLNLEQQQTDHRSHYQVYKELVELRKLPAMRKGRLHAEVLNRNVFAFERELKGHGALITVINIAPEAQTVNLREAFDTQRQMTVMVAGSKSTRTRGDTFAPNSTLSLSPYEGLVLDIAADASLLADRRAAIKLLIKSAHVMLLALLVYRLWTRQWKHLKANNNKNNRRAAANAARFRH